MTGRILAAVAVALLLAAGCGGSDGGSAGGSDRSEGGSAADDVLPAGTELDDGLVVPEGARLAGTVFRRPTPGLVPAGPPPTVDPSEPVPETITPPELGTTTAPPTTAPTTASTPPFVDTAREAWEALLVVDGDPFAVWDDLAAQVRRLGPEVDGSAAACRWWVGPSGAVAPVADGPPDGEVDHLTCETGASGGERHVHLSLGWGGTHPGTIEITVRPHDGPPSTLPGAGVDPTATVDDATRDLLPEPGPTEDPQPGDLFGGWGNCMTGESRLVLPEDAALVATSGGGDGASVLAVDDVQAAMEALLTTSADGPDASSFVAGEVAEQPLAGGGTVLAVGFSVSAGGGACDLLGSPDGRHLLVTMHSD